MPPAPVRPRFEVRTRGDIASCVRALEVACAAHAGCVCRVLDHNVDIMIAPERRHRWSPCVQMELAEDERGGAGGGEGEGGDGQGGVVVYGLVGPMPNVWTLYAVLTAHFAIAFAFALVFGLVQVSLETTPWALWIAGGSAAGALGMYGLSQLGRRLSRDETHELMDLVRAALGGSHAS